jgi:hypothetical protein
MKRLVLALVFIALAAIYGPTFPVKAEDPPEPTGSITATVRCNPATKYNDITITANASVPSEIWTESQFGTTLQLRNTTAGRYTLVLHWTATFQKADVSLMRFGSKGPVYDDSIAGTHVLAVWGAAGPGC